MDVVSMWPLALAGVSSAGLVGAWWAFRQRAASDRASAAAARRKFERKTEQKSDRGGPTDASPVPRGAVRKPASRGKVARQTEDLDTLIDWEPTATRVLTTSEREAWHVLRKALPDHMVLAQVPVARFIKVPTRNPYSEWLRRVGSLCADLVVCDAHSQVIAVVEIRQPISRENERTQRRHARMDRVLDAARIPVHVWLEGALPGPVVAREAILGAAAAGSGPSGSIGLDQVRRDAEAAALVASMQSGGGFHGVSVDERAIDLVIDEAMQDWRAAGGPDNERKEPPPSTWFDDMDSGGMPLDVLESGSKAARQTERA